MYSKLLTVLFLLLVAIIGGAVFYTSKTINDLFGENKTLKQALANIQEESQIGYAKVISQIVDDKGQLLTKIKFMATSPNDPMQPVMEKTYTIEGDVIHFDCLIIKFPERLVLDGKEKALYLWRRIYGENMPPKLGYQIETPGKASARYQNAFESLNKGQQIEFWSRIWDLADNPEALKDQGIEAIYGNVVYRRVKPGLIYIFKIKSTGQVYPEVIPDL